MKNILICGYGNIGTHIEKEFKYRTNVFIYDKYKEEYKNCDLDYNYDAAFVCVPTEMKADGSVNTEEVFDIINRINSKVIILKSTVPVGTCERLKKDHLVFSPEFYGTTQPAKTPYYAILAGSKKNIDKAVQIYQQVKDGSFRFKFTDYRTAELCKDMENCWLATKVTFCNEFATIAEDFGISYPELRECFIMDERVNPSHTFVYEDEPYFNSHCLNKDIPGLISQTDKAELIQAVYNIKKKRAGK